MVVTFAYGKKILNAHIFCWNKSIMQKEISSNCSIPYTVACLLEIPLIFYSREPKHYNRVQEIRKNLFLHEMLLCPLQCLQRYVILHISSACGVRRTSSFRRIRSPAERIIFELQFDQGICTRSLRVWFVIMLKSSRIETNFNVNFFL